MATKAVLECVDIAGLLLSLTMLAVIWRKGLLSSFPRLALLLAAHVASDVITVPLLYFRRTLGIGAGVAYPIFFYSRWIFFFVFATAFTLVIYEVYQRMMAPFEGLQRVGKVVFRWVAIVSVVLSLGLAFGPHAERLSYMAMLAERIEQGSGVLTLCLLLFVCAAAKPLGLTYRSRVFGVTLGLGVLATSTLVEGAWIAIDNLKSVYSPIYLVGSCGFLLACGIWGWYFMVPEPASRMVLLPTTSPFFLWNRVSEALGDEPGYVAVAGFRPDMFEAVELKVLTAASVAARDRQAMEAAADEAEREELVMAQGAMQQSGVLRSVAIQG